MAGHGLQARGIARRNKMLKAATFLFLEQGYDKTTTTQIAKAAGMSQASFFAAFESKEAILLELTKIMFSSQFVAAAAMMPTDDPLLLYALETGLQLHITELSEPLRELYVTTYSLRSTSEYVYQNTTEKLIKIFAPYLPEAQENDFYELEIASASVTRGFMARPCDLYFTMERKMRRYLSCCFRIYKVPQEVYAPVIEAALRRDLKSDAEKIIAATVQRAELGFEQMTTTEGG
mgnify:FL=1